MSKGKDKKKPDVNLNKILQYLSPGEVWEGGDTESMITQLAECQVMLSEIDRLRRREGTSDCMSDFFPSKGESVGDDMATLQEWVERHAEMVVDSSKKGNLRENMDRENLYSPSSKTAIQLTVLDEAGHSKGSYDAYVN